ncbi:coactosin-like protein [Zophobas morio]|uniref:coactosin-like protein n=1 Tax=Zophobas morio TaxID=2755281 RepID=UPI003082C68B
MDYNKSEIEKGYAEVRSDNNEVIWVLVTYSDDSKKLLVKTGTKYDDFLAELQDHVRAYVYVRIQTGDELSKRQKFAFLTFVGEKVSPMKKAKVSTDKHLVKQMMPIFACEIYSSDISDFKYDNVKANVQRAGGANYGPGH